MFAKLFKLSLYRFLVPIPACFLLQFLSGTIYSSGAFVTLLNNSSYTSATTISIISNNISTFLAGHWLSLAPQSRYQSISSCLGLLAPFFAAPMISALGLHYQNSVVLYLGEALHGFAVGVSALVSFDVLQAYVPEARGKACAFGLTSFALGTAVGNSVYLWLSTALHGALRAMVACGIVSSALAALASWFAQRPPIGWHPYWDARLDHQMYGHEKDCTETNAILGDKMIQPELSATDAMVELLCCKSLYMLMAIYASLANPGIAFMILFQTLCVEVLNVSTYTASNVFVGLSMIGVVSLWMAGWYIDRKDSHKSGDRLLQQSCNTALALLTMQAILSMLAPLAMRWGSLTMATMAAAAGFAVCNAGVVAFSGMATGMFGKKGTCAFSMGGIVLAMSNSVFAAVMAACSKLYGESNAAGAYDMLFGLMTVWSATGVCLCWTVCRWKVNQSCAQGDHGIEYV